ncbi:MAG: hypothetical protein WKF78_07795 [Candidatus Limnocylindrales bacterium]
MPQKMMSTDLLVTLIERAGAVAVGEYGLARLRVLEQGVGEFVDAPEPAFTMTRR